MRWLALAAALARRRPETRIVRFSRVVADLGRAEAFHRDGLGFTLMYRGAGDPRLADRLGLPGATMQHSVMRLGGQEVALVRFDRSGAPYPTGSRADDLWFQHLAIVVGGMDEAHRILSAQAPEAISVGGPQVLPLLNGGVSAFKFRDPDGHPLELIHFPRGQGRDAWHTGATRPFLGIDHSALAVAATARSVRFYRRLGFVVSARSWNHGPAQSRLDGLDGADARITGLRPRRGDGPGLELLAYRPSGRPAIPTAANDIVTDWTTIEVPGLRDGPRVLRDPDGHLMVLTAPSPRPDR